MLRVRYQKLIPYPFDVVLLQYYDYEHIAHVHPGTLGEYELISVDGTLVVYEQIWPRRFGRRRRSRVEQRFEPPNRIRFDFVGGLHRGVVVETTLVSRPEGTLVDETYGLPRLPNWSWLARLARPSIVRRVEEVWREDLEVEVCHGGWPGPPPGAGIEAVAEQLAAGETDGAAGAADEWLDLCPTDELGPARRFRVGEREIAVFREGSELFALDNSCPHTGGPLALGTCGDGVVACPWHGARFELESGRCVLGPAEKSVATFEVRERHGKVQLLARAAVPGTLRGHSQSSE